jgi:hypothetical protein
MFNTNTKAEHTLKHCLAENAEKRDGLSKLLQKQGLESAATTINFFFAIA